MYASVNEWRISLLEGTEMVEGRDTKRFRSGDNKKKLVDYIEKGDAKKTNAIGEGEGF